MLLFAKHITTMLYNLTPHAVNVIVSDTLRITYPATGQIARLTGKPQELIKILDDGAPVWTSQELDTAEIPLIPDTATGIIVPMMVGEHLRDGKKTVGLTRKVDIYAPDTSPDGAIRNMGQIVGVSRLVTYGVYNPDNSKIL